uniref:Mediator of RNA polymerase II transcription subunit 11 n=1 Tax=Phallusia mammillata TaxID=59560 RepID=A0A6F9DJW3_9ASCI|nr:mediator of RNA polymerase II transcription subunit 11-like [Phallusia mammillata]
MTTPVQVESVEIRVKKLEDIEKKIVSAIHSAGLTMQELSKDKPTDRNLDKHTSTFLQNLDEAETELATQINYLTQVATNHQHEGSCYSARKRAQLFHEAIAQISTQVNEMVSTCSTKPNT